MKDIIKKRFIDMVEAVKALGLKNVDIAKRMHVSPSTMSNHINPARPIPEEFIEQFIKEFNINRNFYETGAGNILTVSVNTNERNVEKNTQVVEQKRHNSLDNKTSSLSDSEKNINNEYKLATPMYDNPGTASQVEVYNDLQEEGPAFYVSIPQFRDCDFGKSIYGHSMYPTIESGTYIFCKKVENKAIFLPGEIYYIEYDNFAVCKRLKRGPNPDEVILVSDNEEETKDGKRRFEDYIIKIDVINKMFLVKGYFSQSHN